MTVHWVNRFEDVSEKPGFTRMGLAFVVDYPANPDIVRLQTAQCMHVLFQTAKNAGSSLHDDFYVHSQSSSSVRTIHISGFYKVVEQPHVDTTE